MLRTTSQGKVVHVLAAALSVVALVSALPKSATAAPYPDTPFHLPHDEITDFLEENPSPVAKVAEIGRSRFGDYPIEAIVVSDNPDMMEDEPVLLFVGVIHGREVLGGRAVMKLVETLTEGYGKWSPPGQPNITDIVDAFRIVIVPVLNPYGYENELRKNGPVSSGVDLNRNAGFRWDRCDNKGDRDCLDSSEGVYRGSGPFSEPETAALRDLVERLRPVAGITFHAGQGGPVGTVYYPWGTGDYGDDNKLGTCDDLIVEPPIDKQLGRDLAGVVRNAVETSRSHGRFCDGSSEVSGACAKPVWGVLGSTGATNAYHHAATGMFDLLIETNGDLDGDGKYTSHEAFRNDYFYERNPALNASEESHYRDAEEYVRNYNEGMLALLDHFLHSEVVAQSQAGPRRFRYTGPGVTGRVLDHHGHPLSAIVRVKGLDETLHADFTDNNCDGTHDDDDEPFGEEDLKYRRSEPKHGRFFRMLEPGTYTLEFSADGLETIERQVTVGGEYMEDLLVVLDPPTFPCNEQGIRDALGHGGDIIIDCQVPQTVTLSEGQLVIDKDVSMNGLRHLTIDAGGASRVFRVNAPAVAELIGINITGGHAEAQGDDGGGVLVSKGSRLTLRDSHVYGNVAVDRGGGIATGGELILIESDVKDNSAIDVGGGIWVTGSQAMATIEQSDIDNNHSDSSGGGIWTSGTLVTILDSSVSGNDSGKHGGAIRAYSGAEVFVADSAIAKNVAAESGGAIANGGGRVLLERTTVALNRAKIKGGAIENGSNSALEVSDSFISSNTAKYGGAIYNSLGTVGIEGTTLHGNAASTGGAIRTYKRGSGSYDVFLLNSTVTGNRASSQGGAIASKRSAVVQLTHTTVVENSAYSGTAVYQDYDSTCEIEHSVIDGSCVSSQDSALTSSGYNALSRLCRVPFAHGDRVLTTQQMSLGTLYANGGYAPTHLPNPGSPLVDAIPANECTFPFDQRRKPRGRGYPCDIGAVEVQRSDEGWLPYFR